MNGICPVNGRDMLAHDTTTETELYDASTELSIQNRRKKGIENFQEFMELVHPETPANSQRAFESDLKCYLTYCDNNELERVSPSSKISSLIIKQYFEHLCDKGLSRSTINRRLATIGKVYRLLECPEPLKSNENLAKHIKLKLARMKAPTQVKPVRFKDINTLPELTVDSPLKAIRNRMLFLVGFSTLARASELLELRVSDIDLNAGTAFISRSKTDQDGEGRYANLINKAKQIIKIWLERTGLSGNQKLFTKVHKSGVSSNPLTYNGYLGILKEVIEEIMEEPAKGYGTHSLRVGSAVSMAEKGVSIVEIAQAGGWKTTTMPLHYTRQSDATKIGTAHFDN